MLSDYKCIECKKIIEYKKPYGIVNFPEYTKCDCGSDAKRVLSNINITIPDGFKAARD